MTDAETDCLERYVTVSDSEQVSESDVTDSVNGEGELSVRGDGESSSGEGELSVHCPADKDAPPRKMRAKTARDLVKRQEGLLTMLQQMKSDLAKMDREARQIKEDVVRSKQMVHVMVHNKQPHHLPPSLDGYHLSYALPKVSYGYRPRTHSQSSARTYLHSKLSTFAQSSSSSRRSSINSQYSTRSRSVNNDLPSRRHSRHDQRFATSSATEDDNNSGTESDVSHSSRRWARNSGNGSISNISQDSGESPNEAAGSSTESASSLGRASPEEGFRTRCANRRSSYIYTPRDQQADVTSQSDDVDL